MGKGLKVGEITYGGGQSAVVAMPVRKGLRRKRQSLDATALLLAPCLALLLLCLGIPLIVILVSSFQPNVLLQRDSSDSDCQVFAV